MREYFHKQMEEFAAELSAGLTRLKKGYIDAAESLIQIMDPSRSYPLEFVVYRLTGYRPGRAVAAEPMAGDKLCHDLLNLMLDVCDSFELRAEDYDEPVYDTEALSERFHVSTKTIQRWRSRGLPGRRLVFADGKRRVAFTESSMRWFVRTRQRQVLRSMRFSQMTGSERDDIIRRARRMARATNCSVNEVSRRLAVRMGRAVETIRYTIRRHDAENPRDAVFADSPVRLGDQEKIAIYRNFLSGMRVPALADQYDRTRGSIYRIINEIRAQQLKKRPISCMYNPQFDLPNADELILGTDSSPRRLVKGPRRAPPELPPYLRALYAVPLLSSEDEKDMFRRYNYLKYKADELRRAIEMDCINSSQLREIEKLLLQANVVKNQIIRANLRLVVSIAKKHVGGPQSLFELVSDGNVSLMRAVEKFDYSRGNRFSTYASWAIMRNFARSVPRERYLLDRFSTGHDEILDIAAALRTYDPNELNLSELRESIDVILAQLSPTERTILIDHYGLDSARPPRTFQQLGQYLGMSKERVRQIESKALAKLRKILHPQQADLMS